jgi:WD40 repeat protein
LALWDLAAGKLRQKLPLSSENNPGVCGAAFSADERRVAVAESSINRRTHRILVWDLDSSKSRVLWSEEKEFRSFYFEPVVIFSPDGKRLIGCHYDQILRCWEIESGKLLWQSEKKNWSPLIVFSADGRTVMIPSGIGTNGINVWDAATGKLLESKKPPKEALFPIGISPDGRFLAFQTGKEEVVLWELGKEKVSFRFPRPPHRRDDPIYFQPNRLPTNFAFTPDSKGFIRRAGALQRWDLATGKPLYTETENWGHTEDMTRLLFSPDRRLLASSSKDQTVRLWNLSTVGTVHVFCKHDSDHLVFTSDGHSLLTVPYFTQRGCILQARDVISGRPERAFGLADHPNVSTSIRGKELRLTADHKKILMMNWEGDRNTLMVWNAVTGECLVNKDIRLREQPLTQEESRFAPDGQSVLAFDHVSQAVRLLSLETVRPRWQLKMEPAHNTWHYYACNLALSPNGRMMAARLSDPNLAGVQKKQESIILADMGMGRQIAKLPADGPAIFDFSADSRVFAVAGPEGVHLWETAIGKEIGIIPISNRDTRPQDRACASSLAFSADGRILATGHADGTVLLWDATLRGSERGGQLSAAQRETLWNDLAGMDAVKAYAAIARLADNSASPVAFLKERLKPVSPVPPDVLRPLLEDLDSDQFAVREAAQQKLRELGEQVASSLRAELKTKPSLEKRKRIEEVLAGLDESRPVSGEPLRGLRAVQLLERIGSVEARELLEALSRGVETARLTQAAKEGLTRLKKR